MYEEGKNNPIHLKSTGALPFYRSVNSLSILSRFLEKQGVDAGALLSGSGIQTSDFDDPDVLVPLEKELMVLRKIPALSKDPEIGLKIGQYYHVGIQGKVGAAAMSSETLLDAIRIAFQYTALTLAYCQYDLKVMGNLAFMRMKELIDLEGIRIFVCEREFVSVHRMVGDLLGMPFQLHELRLAYTKPAYGSSYQDIFRCPVRFNAPEHTMIFNSRYLSMPLPMANPLAKNVYEKECKQQCLRLKIPEAFADRARHLILFSTGKFPDFSQMARSMNVSPRTLRRRLTVEGTSYKTLVEEIRKKKAIDLLEKTSCSTEHIAFELGYSNTPNFYRAFKVWSGKTPSEYRRKINPQDGE